MNLLPPRPDWMDDAACRSEDDPDMFAALAAGRGSVDAARKVCGGCPVVRPCLWYALRYRMRGGVWGGMTEEQRRKVLREKGIPWNRKAAA